MIYLPILQRDACGVSVPVSMYVEHALKTSPLSHLGEAALVLSQEYGFPVFPCVPRTKSPLLAAIKHDGTPWKRGVDDLPTQACKGGFYRASTLAEQVGEWWDRWPDANIGVRLGGIMRLGLVEADTPEAEKFLSTLDWCETPRYRASRGVNYLVQVPEGIDEKPTRHLWPDRFGHGLEVKTGAGFFVAPPSVHPSGHVYEWCKGTALEDVPLAPMPSVIADALRQIDDVRRVAAVSSTGIIREVVGSGMSSVLTPERIIAYLHKVPTGLSNGRKQTTYALAAALYTRLGCSASQVRSIVDMWNACNIPPLTASVCDRIVADALTYAPRKAA